MNYSQNFQPSHLGNKNFTYVCTVKGRGLKSKTKLDLTKSRLLPWVIKIEKSETEYTFICFLLGFYRQVVLKRTTRTGLYINPNIDSK